MFFLNNVKFAGLFVAVASCALLAQARIKARNAMAEVSVVFYDDIGPMGASYSPAEISPGVCQDLPGNWLDRPESFVVGPGWTCDFYVYTGCEGTGTQFSGNQTFLLAPVYNSIESFSCNKQIGA